MIGQTISHFRILEKLGGGGMGVVYKAEDTKLKRTVALKFLPPDLTRDEEAKQRFIHEAQAASALQHNNICNIHDIDETGDGQLFIVMDCYAGETLKEKIAHGPMKLEEAVNVGGQIAEGLSKAHEKGIVHRDIKPANIVITNDGVVKILDFGLAKLAGQARVTKTGSTIGTAAYMSPEQARGEEVDQRTDIWSVGIALYEMLTGKLPFRGEHEAALLYSIVHEEPQTIASFRAEVPQGVVLVIGKALQKDRLQRYQTVKELANDLKSALTQMAETPKQEKSIVVLPFENLSPDPDQEYFSDGLTEEVISDLSAVRSLRVISRSSAMTFKGTKKKVPEIAREVNVQYVLEGSVRKAGNSLRITAQLINAQDDNHIWAEKYSGTLDDVFDIQEKVSRSIVDALKLKLTPEEERTIANRPIENAVAYEYYLKANQDIYRMTEDALDRALRYLHNAIDIVGDNALLYSGVAWAHWMYVNMGLRQEDYLEKSEACVKKALALDSDSAQANAVLGWIVMFRRKTKEAICHLKRALAVSPDESLALQGLATVYICFAGKISAAVPLCEKLLRTDPLDFGANWFHAALFFYDGQYNKAVQLWHRLYGMYPEAPYSQFSYALTLIYQKETDEAFSIIDRSAKANPDLVTNKLLLMLKHAVLNDKETVLRYMTPDFQRTCMRDPSYCHNLAGIFALLPEKQLALDWLENAVNRGFINYPLLAEKDTLLANIRGEERFKKLMEQVKKEWEEFEV